MASTQTRRGDGDGRGRGDGHGRGGEGGGPDGRGGGGHDENDRGAHRDGGHRGSYDEGYDEGYDSRYDDPADAGDSRRGPGPAPAAPAQPKKSRAGRDLRAALGVSAVLGGVILGSLFVRGGFAVVVGLAVLIGIRELAQAMSGQGVRVPLPPVAVGGAGMIIAAWFGGPTAVVAVLAMTCLAVMVWRMAEGADGFLRDATAGLFTTVYVPLLASFAVLMLAQDSGYKRVLVFLFLPIANDTGGYATGVFFGKHKLAPKISPGKTWEGLVGSLIITAGVGALGLTLLLHGQAWQGALLGVAAVASATLGDLIESVIKRDLGVKDMGNLLPGHGGIMDRLDSMLATAPVAWLLISAFLGFN